MLYLLFALLLVFGIAATWLLVGAVRRLRFKKLVEKAIGSFDKQREKMKQQFFETASQSGKPRGLRWKQCDFQDAVEFATDTATGDIYALVGVTISFEAIKGGGMEEVEAVGNLRAATGLFVFRQRHWTTDGRAIFNLEPREALERYRESLQPLRNQDSAIEDE